MQSSLPVLSPPIKVLVGLVLAFVAFAVSTLLVWRHEDGDVVIIANPTSSEIVVEIRGEVQNPGVYRLIGNSRLGDLIAAAGGSTDRADLGSINLARRLVDGEQVVIPPIAPATPEVASDSERPVNSPQSVSFRININTASQADLESLPGIGPVIAKRIIQYRTDHGPFSTATDLANVEGVSDTLIDEISSLITTGP